MVAVLARETRLSLPALAAEEAVALATVVRWTSSGVRGHKLESFYVGHRKFTTREAYRRWLNAINGEPAELETVAHGA